MGDFFADILWWFFPLMILAVMTMIVLAVARSREESLGEPGPNSDDRWNRPED